MRSELSENVRSQIVILSKEGFSQRQIMDRLKVSKGGGARDAEACRRDRLGRVQSSIGPTQSDHAFRRSVHQTQLPDKQEGDFLPDPEPVE